jgi:hypothetical protein
MTLFFIVGDDHFETDSSTTAISSAISPYNPYTSESICRSVDPISIKEEHKSPRFCRFEYTVKNKRDGKGF